jgi:hypothetical protein
MDPLDRTDSTDPVDRTGGTDRTGGRDPANAADGTNATGPTNATDRASRTDPGRTDGTNATGPTNATDRTGRTDPDRTASAGQGQGQGQTQTQGQGQGQGQGPVRRPTRRLPPLTRLPALAWERQPPTWRAARPGIIEGALKRALDRQSGNWYALAASRRVRSRRPLGATVAGVEVVVWRGGDGRVLAGPGACPHLGAPLCQSAVVAGRLVCHWHGLSLGARGAPGWHPYPAYDDGVLVWVRLDEAGGGEPTQSPPLPVRPDRARTVEAVATQAGRCEAQDVLANRLDPWHGAWFHPYAFARLTVLEEPDEDNGDRFLVDVSYRTPGRTAIPVRAEFTAPGPRTVVMRIVDGEGATSTVETHATPLTPDGHPRPRTAVIEAVLASSGRPGFALAQRAAPLLRPLMRRAAARLWRDDIAYAERRWLLRSQDRFPG